MPAALGPREVIYVVFADSLVALLVGIPLKVWYLRDPRERF